MTPATRGVIERLYFGEQHRIRVVPGVFTSDVTVLVERCGSDDYAVTEIKLDEDGRRELIELLGGTP